MRLPANFSSWHDTHGIAMWNVPRIAARLTSAYRLPDLARPAVAREPRRLRGRRRSAAPRRAPSCGTRPRRRRAAIVSRHEAVEVEAALQVEVDQHREVAAREAVAVPRRLQRAAAAEELDHRELGNFIGGSRHADLHDACRRGRGRRTPARSTSGLPTASMHTSAPLPSVRALDRLDGVGLATRRRCAVAPNSFAHSSFVGSRSTAMIVRAPARRAPAMAASPTPPQPNTATVSPRWTLPV